MKTLINSIFRASEGEGVRIGTPQVMIRFQGCNIGCLNCDTKESWEFSDNYSMDVDDIISRIEELAGSGINKIKNASITGGDPTHPKLEPGVLEVAKRLKKLDYFVNVEASGTRISPEIFNTVDFISFDYKTPSTGVKTQLKLIEKLSTEYTNKFQIKSVIADAKDFKYTYDSYLTFIEANNTKVPWCLTPSYEPGESFPRERFLNVIKMNEDTGALFRVVGQQHKWLYGPDEQLV